VGARTSIVIVTYNSREFIPRCLSSLQQHSPDSEIVVVDNASRDGTADFVEHDYPAVRLIRRRRNNGLSSAINEGVRASSGEYVLQTNPDTHVTEDVVSPLAEYLAAHPDTGIVAPKLLNEDGSLQLSCRSFPGYSTALFNRYSLLTRLFPGNRYSRDYLLTNFDHASIRDVDWVSGAAMMFCRTVFDELGGWDERFFLFNEDVDFCKRVHDAGYRVTYFPRVSVYHGIGVSESPSATAIIERHKSIWRYYRKHMRGSIVRDAATGVAIAGRCSLMLAASGVRRVAARVRP
jgi:GT2 family glycosyltransferase